jgi:uncharacterized Tic20 family protein
MSADSELDKLKKMRDDGTITDEQYERAVAELEEERAAERARRRRRERDRDEDEDDRDERRPARRRHDDYDDDDEEALSPRQLEKKSREWAMWLHLSILVGHFALLAGIVAPIIMWQSKKDEYPRIDRHGKNAVNWLISYYIYLAISFVLCFVFVGFVLLPVVLVLGIVFPIMAAMKANEGRVWPYPLAIPFLS